METTKEVKIDEVIEQELPSDAVNLIKAEGYQLTNEIQALKVSNRFDYELAITKGIWNANILKRLEELRKALLLPFQAQVKKINESFDKAMKLFESNDEKVRKALKSYQGKVDIDNIKTIHTEMGSATIQERKDFDILDEDKIPREYLKPDETKIRRAVVAGVLEDSKWLKVKPNLVTAFKAA